MVEQWNKAFQNRASNLGGDEWTLELDNSIKPGQQQHDWYQYIRNGFAHFYCSMCDRSWPSRRVQVVFHFTLNSSVHRGTVKIREFKQACRECFMEVMEEPIFSTENIDMMVEKLIEKIRIKYYGEKPTETNRNFSFDYRTDRPHESDYCEACLLGICQQGIENF